jgi:hypothetical protein
MMKQTSSAYFTVVESSARMPAAAGASNGFVPIS